MAIYTGWLVDLLNCINVNNKKQIYLISLNISFYIEVVNLFTSRNLLILWKRVYFQIENKRAMWSLLD